MESVITAIASVVVGLGIGLLSGLLGIGGGTLMVPVFKLGYLMPPIVCTGTSLFVIILTSISGAGTHIKKRTCLPKLGIAAGVGGACMSPVGVWLASISPEWAIMVAAAAVIIYSSVTMFRKALKMPKPVKVAASASATTDATTEVVASEPSSAMGSSTDVPELPTIDARELAIGFAIGLGAGILSGYVGVGGGFIMVPLLMSLLKTPMKLTAGTSLIAVLILAIPGVITQASLGNVNWVAGIAIAIGTVPGAIIGSRLVERVPERTLRFLFSAILCVAAIMLVVDQF